MRTITLTSDAARMHIAPQEGGRIAQLEARVGDAWLPLLIAPPASPADAGAFAWGSFAMLPWPNRIAGAQFSFRGVTYALAANRDGHALHGLGAQRAWTVDEETDRTCVLSLDLGAAGWPLGGTATQRYEATGSGVTMEIELRARDAAYPAGAGWHPWFRRNVSGSEARIALDAGSYYELDVMIPTGRVLPVDATRDLRDGPALGDRRLDDCYRDVRSPIVVSWGDVSVEMRRDAGTSHAVVYTPEHAVCVEPQTCAIDAFNLAARGIDAGVRIVAPGRPFVARSEWRIHSAR